MPVHRTIRIGWFNRQTQENGAGVWVPNRHIGDLRRRTIRLNQMYPFIIHWIEERTASLEAVNLGSNYQTVPATATLPPPPPDFSPPPDFPPPGPPPYPPPFPSSNNITQHLYGDS